MTIARRLSVAVIIPAVAALLTVAALAWSHRVTVQVQQKARTARQLADGVGELNDMVLAYLLHRDERPVQQFHAVQEDMKNLLVSTRFANPDQARLASALQGAMKLMGDAFGQLTSQTGRSEAAKGTTLARDAEERLTGQVLVRSREALSDVQRLDGLLDGEVAAVNRTAGWLVVALVLVVAALVTSILLPMMGGITRSLAMLQHSVDRVGAGDLSHRAGMNARDEIGGLAQAFDAMTARLQATVVSRDALAAEVEQRRQTEEALRESEEKFTKAFRSAPYAAALTRTQDGLIVEVNDTFLEISGYSRNDVLGKTADELGIWVHPEDRSAVFEELSRNGRVRNREYQFRTKNGGTIVGLFSAEIIRLANQPAILSSISDITERERAEEALRLSEQKFALAFAGNPAAVALTRLEDGLILEVNDTWLAMSGYSREEAIGHSARKMRIWPSPEAAARFVAELKANGALRGWEHKFLKKSGELYWAELSAQLLVIGGEKVILSTMVDITARKRAEQALRESEERFRSVLENSRDVIVRVHIPEGRFEYVSPSCALLVGYSAEEIMAMPAEQSLGLVHPDDVPALRSATAQSEAEGEAEAEYRQRRKDGSYVWVSNRMSVEKDEAGRPLYRTFSLRDVTERKEAEAAVRRNEATLRGILDATSESVWLFSTDGTVLQANATALKRVGRTGPEMIGRSFEEMMPPELARSRRARLLEVVELAQPVEFDDERAGVHFRHNFYPVLNPDGRVSAVVSYSRDVTGQKQAEEQNARQLAELQRWQAVMLDREDRNMELKREVNELLRRMGEPVRYPSQAAEDAGGPKPETQGSKKT